jgi:hypothetical protein
MRKLLASALAAACILPSLARGQAAPDYYVIPMKADPPIVVDGDLSDWANVPCALTMKDKSHVTFGQSRWNGPEDLSAVIHMAWRADTLCVAAEVIDDHVVQPLTGADLWKADHVSVLMDFTPGANPAQTMLGEGQFHVELSPGDLTSDSPKPEVFCGRPANAPVKDARIVSRKTATGYVIEASIPFTSLGLKPVVMYQDANFEVFVSDADDAASPTQEKIVTVGTQPWVYNRTGLLPVVFGDGNGKGKAPVRSVALLDKGQVEAGKKLEVTFDAPAISAGKAPYVFFEARLQYRTAAGASARSLLLELNGKPVEGKRISNRPASSMTMSGREANFIAPDGFMTMPYAPNAKSFDQSPQYGLIGVKGCEFEFDLAGLLKEGKNTLVFHNECKATEANAMLIAVERVELRVKAPPPPPPPPREAPTGPLMTCEPATEFPKTFSALKQERAKITFTVNGEEYTAASEFTAPDGKWHTASTAFYEYRRKVVEHDEWIEVSDTFKNLTKENLPIMHRHRLAVSGRPESFALAGLNLLNRTGGTSAPENPTAFLATARSGAGLAALDDVFRVHGRESVQGGALFLADEELVLKPGVEYTAEWLIVPVAQPDLWAFINTTRRQMDANFPIKYQFAFTDFRKPMDSWTDEQFKRYLDYKAVDIACQSLYCGTYKGHVPHGLAFNEMPETYNFYTDFIKRLKRVYPDGHVKHAVYYHCYADVIEENAQRFKDCRITDAAGNPMTYGGEAWLKLYLPTLDNAWGKAIGQGIDIRLDTIKTQSIYWDEFSYSSAKYTYNTWDGWTGDIDPKTFQLKGLRAAVHLAALDFLVFNARRIMDRVPLIANGAPQSRTTARLKYQNFVETGSISNCRSTLLHCPVALGDHLTERTEQDCYNVMLKALDNGCLYNWYSDTVIPTYSTLASHMFPFTPIELHEGWIVGKERILSNRSGVFGWGDASHFKWYVYDREGKATDGHEVKQTTHDGKTYAEVRLPEGYSVAIVRE